MRTCFECKHFLLCFLRHRIDSALHGINMINIDGDAAPGKWVQIWETLAMICLQFKPKEGE